MKLLKIYVYSLLSVLGACSQSYGDSDTFSIRNGERVVFYGDSITDWRLYTTFVETFFATRFPEIDVEFTHSGWGGDTVRGGAGGDIRTRLERDVISYNPTLVTVMLGMNDGGYKPFDERLCKDYRAGMSALVNLLQGEDADVEVFLLKPSAYDDVTQAPKFDGGYNQVLIRYGDELEEIASEGKNIRVVDLNKSTVEVLKKANETDPVVARKMIPDRVHPREGIHLVMASDILRSWNVPAVVSDVEVDFDRKALAHSENTEISELKFFEDAGEWKRTEWIQLDASLPMPFDDKNDELQLARSISDFDQVLNRQILRISGLPKSVSLSIDGKNVGVFTPEEFAEGVNLAVFKTPMTEQANAVHRLTQERVRLHQVLWRTFMVPYADILNSTDESGQNKQVYLREVLKDMASARDATACLRKEVAHPLPRKYEIVPVKEASRTQQTQPSSSGVRFSIQPDLSVRYGNAIEAGKGRTLIFSEKTDIQEFIESIYAVDAQRKNIIKWNPNEKNHRPLVFGDTKWNGRSSLTWKIKAPEGYKFASGRVVFEGTTVWKNSGLTFYAHSSYGLSDDFERLSGEGVRYGEDCAIVPEPWQWNYWSVDVPEGVTEFYVTILKELPWVGAWGNNLRTENVVLEAL